MTARLAVVLLAGVAVVAEAQAQRVDLVDRTALRVCADPANLPFSNDKGEGFENKIAEIVAADLKLPVEYTWFPQATGFIRQTLFAKRCDVVLGYAQGDDLVAVGLGPHDRQGLGADGPRRTGYGDANHAAKCVTDRGVRSVGHRRVITRLRG